MTARCQAIHTLLAGVHKLGYQAVDRGLHKITDLLLDWQVATHQQRAQSLAQEVQQGAALRTQAQEQIASLRAELQAEQSSAQSLRGQLLLCQQELQVAREAAAAGAHDSLPISWADAARAE